MGQARPGRALGQGQGLLPGHQPQQQQQQQQQAMQQPQPQALAAKAGPAARQAPRSAGPQQRRSSSQAAAAAAAAQQQTSAARASSRLRSARARPGQARTSRPGEAPATASQAAGPARPGQGLPGPGPGAGSRPGAVPGAGRQGRRRPRRRGRDSALDGINHSASLEEEQEAVHAGARQRERVLFATASWASQWPCRGPDFARTAVLCLDSSGLGGTSSCGVK